MAESKTKLKTPEAEITNGASKEGFPDYEDSHSSAHGVQGYDSLEEYESYFSKIIVSTSEEARCSSSDEDKHKSEEEEQLVPCERIKEFLDPGIFTTSVYPSHIRELSIIVDDAYRLLKRGTVGGEWGLDLGCGPMLQYSLMLGEHVNNLVVANYLDQTKAIVEGWLKDDQSNALNLNAVLQSVAEVTKRPCSVLKEQLKARIRDHVSCDLFSKETGKFLPGKYDANEMYDVIVTSLLLEAVIQELGTYARIIKRISGLLKRRGHLLMNGVMGMTYWDMKAGKFNCVTLTKDNVEKVLKDCGFVDLEWTIVDREYFHSVSDYTKTFLVLARKP